MSDALLNKKKKIKQKTKNVYNVNYKVRFKGERDAISMFY